MKSNEKPSVCNTFAALYPKTPVNTGILGYQKLPESEMKQFEVN